MSERQIAAFMQSLMDEMGVGPAWGCTTVQRQCWPRISYGHLGPSEIILQRGHILHIDFGVARRIIVQTSNACVLSESGEGQPPEAVQRGFDTIVHAIQPRLTL